MEKVKKTLYCKKAVTANVSGSLQQALHAALTARQTAKSRVEPASKTANRFRVIAQHYLCKGSLVGVFLAYEPGSKAASLINDPSAELFELEHFAAPPVPGGGQREWVEGLLFFLVREDHVVLIQSAAVRIEQFEHHLCWLLTTPDSLPADVKLHDQPPRNVERLIRESHVKSIVVDGSLMEPERAEESAREVRVTSGIVLGGPMLEGIKGMFDGAAHDLGLRGALEGSIEARLELSYKRSVGESAQQLLDRLAGAFRNLDGVDTCLVLNNGDRITRDQLRLLTQRNIKTKDGALIALDAFDVMHAWLDELVNTDQL